jgi:anti-sigma regulatory factor (Ser/Thr protein kinase)
VSPGVVERLELPAEAPSVRQARAFVRDVVRRSGREDLVDVATLLVSELATNVVLHAKTAFAVVVDRLKDGVRFDVLDNAPGQPAVREHDLSSPSGRGLVLLSSMADVWGPTPRDALNGYTKGVRFELR